VGTDKAGNKFFENLEELPRTFETPQADERKSTK
jgi:hypothetical protein